ncbi:hypothetical protein CWT12_01495 [Actinomyces sp. 432]|uniref:hypothetical protein n=1 Tax=Actinomyces sp. 432 TaxID=2057798 RepID=UPI001373939D|nr:hypothetical protein [Actinomyces sp. 432]QHO90276.1 hypothetical protein CWT12_01495 [Actinomyces sp. 432]
MIPIILIAILVIGCAAANIVGIRTMRSMPADERHSATTALIVVDVVVLNAMVGLAALMR